MSDRRTVRENGQTVTIREAFAEASSFLRAAGVQDAAGCAELLLMHLLGLDKTALLLRWSEPLAPGPEREAAWREMLRRKAAGEPVQYIIGEQEFYGLPFEVTPAVLIPRPETELLVEAVVRAGRGLWPDGAPLVADIGTGSGAIAVTAAVQCPSWSFAGSDISAAALEVARRNAARHGVTARINFVQGDLLMPFIERRVALDAVVSNPPYIAADELPGLQPEVRLHEPVTALVGGVDGLDPYRRLTEQLPQLPRMPRLVAFEYGQGQAPAIADMLGKAADWDELRIIPDLAGIDRHILAIRKK
ncbi:peptide chain release factor N(5)-glutamine methyltransferase [Paenibacillus hamazuiensis]|uniref:peptide chain release factor N(5)-glutamine methyltransferase n=1 Tax=Paenibacillus hamazuiensis TaxID=2936508 RepID=UPI00200DD9D0|nr:peptide chain release factor N(5)-glutamine methyltransferase [Paenibacillus hamazuiensis]